MNRENLWSLRLGFSSRQSAKISALGLDGFLSKSFSFPAYTGTPELLKDSPKTLADFPEIGKTFSGDDPQTKQAAIRDEIMVNIELKAWWIQKMHTDEFPLREKMTCFWHNHFVSTYQKVKLNHWVYDHNRILRQHAFKLSRAYQENASYKRHGTLSGQC